MVSVIFTLLEAAVSTPERSASVPVVSSVALPSFATFSTVMFAPDGSRLLGLDEIVKQIKTLKNPNYKPERQRGWRVSGLADEDAGGVYTEYRVAEYLAGYAGPPPTVQLRRGETLRRYLKPEPITPEGDYVFWGMNYKQAGVPGPARDRTWVNQPENMYGSKKGTGYKAGQLGNAAGWERELRHSM